MKITSVQKNRGVFITRRGNIRPTNIYVWPQGESIMQNLQNRRQRPYTLYKKVLREQLADHGITLPDEVHLAWNQRAGCSCPCSPGFVLKNRLTGEQYRLRDEQGFFTLSVNVEE